MLAVSGKTTGLDHSCPDNIDHLKSDLSICCLAMYVNCNLIGERWTISLAFARTVGNVFEIKSGFFK